MSRKRGNRGGRGRSSAAAESSVEPDVEAPLLTAAERDHAAPPPASAAAAPTRPVPPSASACALADAAAASGGAPSRDLTRRLTIGLVLAAAFCLVEALGGLAAHSLALATDAAHLLSDGLGFGVALWAARASSSTPSDSDATYGGHRAEVLAALASTAVTWVVTGGLVVEAVSRLATPSTLEVDGRLMFGLGLVGVVMNLILLYVLGGDGHSHDAGGGHAHDHGEDGGHDAHAHAHAHDHGHAAPAPSNINARAAWLHVVGDLVQSVGVAAAGGAVYVGGPRWAIADPLCTFLFAALVMATTVGLSRDMATILMERAPPHQAAKLAAALAGVPDIASVADLHCWLLKPGMPLATAHVRAARGVAAERVRVGARAALARAGVAHATVEVEESA